MKILVIDDSQSHQQSARQTLGSDHDLTVVGSHDEALEALSLYDENYDEKELYWDVVLSDLLMPAGKAAQGGPGLQYVGTEMPVGWSLAIEAALNGAKYVAVVTDMNHHHHPASAMLNGMGRIFTLNNAKALFTNHVRMIGIEGTEKTCEECGGTGEKSRNDGSTYKCYTCNGTGTDYNRKGKNWARILQQVMDKEEL